MNQNKHVRWLYDELPKLVAQGVLDESAAERIRAHYGPLPERRAGSLALAVFGIIGGGLVALGIILILANNWEQLSRPLRAGIAFGVLLVAQAIAGYAALKRPPSRALNEGAGLFLGLCIGACIALIGQTYHIPGDLGSFLLTWTLLALPVVYLLNAGTVAIGYFAGITAWSAYVQDLNEHALMFWPLAALGAPFVYMTIRKEPYTLRTSWVLLGLSICAIVAAGVAMDRSLPGLWIPMYASLFGVMYMGGAFLFHEAESFRQKPIYGIGATGLTIMTFVFTFDEPWDSIGWHYYRYGDGYFEYAAIADYILTGALLAGVVILLVTAVRRQRASYIPLGAMPLLAVVCFGITAGTDDEFIARVLFNVYLFAVSIFTIVHGVRTDRLEIVNSGMLMFSVLVTMRFFDIDFSFVERGLAFIAIGAGFLITNIVLISRKRAKA